MPITTTPDYQRHPLAILIEAGLYTPPAAASAWADITGKPTFGTASALNVPASAGAQAASGEVVRGDDPRLAGTVIVDSKADTAAVSLGSTNTITTLGTATLPAGRWRLTASVVAVGAAASMQKLEASITPGNAILKTAADVYACTLAPTTALTGEVGTLNIGPSVVTVPSGTVGIKLNARAFFTAGAVTAYHTLRAEYLGPP